MAADAQNWFGELPVLAPGPATLRLFKSICNRPKGQEMLYVQIKIRLLRRVSLSEMTTVLVLNHGLNSIVFA